MKKLWFILLSVGFVYLLAFQFLPFWTIWLYFFGALAFISLAKTPMQALGNFFLVLPFFFVLPNNISSSLSMWRPLSLVLFLRIFWTDLSYFATHARFWQDPKTPQVLRKKIAIWARNLFPYEKLALVLLAMSLLSLIFANFKLKGLEQVLFLVNAGLLYPITARVLKNGGNLKKLLSYLSWSSGTVVVLGYAQLLLSIFVPFYYFWQFWASNIANLFYGRGLSDVLVYSNSWFSREGGMENLRMFSVMPSSHAFAMVCVFFLAFFTPMLAVRIKRKKIFPINKERYFTGKPWNESLKEFWSGRMPIWYALRFAGLGVVLSGTRGVWVGMFVPLVVSIFMWVKKIFTPYAKLWTMVLSLVVLFFIFSPFINMGLNAMRMSNFRENFIDRAASIYDLDEQSNVGRIQIWQESLRFALDNPLGVGYANFITSLNNSEQDYAEIAEEKNTRYNLPQRYVTAHSLYLQLLVELSVLGLFLFATLWLMYFKSVYLYLKECAKELNHEVLVVFSISMAMLWFLAYSAFDLTWLNDKILLYTFVSLGVVKTLMQSTGENLAIKAKIINSKLKS